MEGAVAAALYGLETVAEGAVALAHGLTLSTAPLKAAFKPIKAPSIPRSSHTLSVVKNRAYIFGGEISPRQPVDNAMHIVTLPSTELTEADYQEIPAKSSSSDGEVPAARVGHTASVIGGEIYVFGGRGGSSMSALEENGRVWVFSTTTKTWSHLDPEPSAPHPEARSYHASASTAHPLPPPSHSSSTPAPDADLAYPEDPSTEPPLNAEPPPPYTYGTLIIHAGCLSSGSRTSDTWSFDVSSRTWAPFPTAPDPARGGTSLALVHDRLYRFGGFDGTRELGGAMDYLDLNISDEYDDKSGKGLMALAPRPPATWRSNVFAPSSDKDGKGGNRTAPANRSVCGLAPVSTGQGRKYLLVVCGEGEASKEGHAGAGRFFDDVWSFQLKPEGGTASAVKDATRSVLMGKETGEADAVEVRYFTPTAEADRMVQEGQKKPLGRRGWFASSNCEDAVGVGSVLVWGGVGEDNERLGDGWIISVE